MSYKWEHKYNMSYKVNKVAKFELENFKCVVEIFGLPIDFRSMLLDQKCFHYCLLCSVACIVTFGSIWDPVMLLLWICW